MHEMALAESILGIIEETLHNHHFSIVTEIRLEIGALSGVEIEALTFCLDVVLKNTSAAGARLEIERPPGCGWCLQCNETIFMNTFYDPCPKCAGYQVRITNGTEMRVKDLLAE